jgi:hypothetical protein
MSGSMRPSASSFDPRLALSGRGCWPQPLERGKEMPRRLENQGWPWVEEGATLGTGQESQERN